MCHIPLAPCAMSMWCAAIACNILTAMCAVIRRLRILKDHQRNVEYVDPEERAQPEGRVRQTKRRKLTSTVPCSSDEDGDKVD